MTEPSDAIDPGSEEAAYALERKDVSAILYAVDIEDRAQLTTLMEPLHPADIADLLEQINAYDRSRLIRLYDREFDGEILSELDEAIREEVIAVLKPHVLAEAVRELDSDDVVDLIEDLDDAQQEQILGALEESDRAMVEQSLTFPEYSAGRLMQREVVMAPEHWTVGEAIDRLRDADEEALPRQFYHIVLVDPRLHPIGNVTLGKLMRSRREVMLKDLVEETFQIIPATQDESDVAYAFNQYHLISAPVVDDEGRLIGAITIDDAMAVLDEEHEEDILRLAGVGEESALSDRVRETTGRRLPWLAVNLVTSILASLVIAQFDAAIAQIVALAVLMPIVASMGGIAGTQTLTLVIRGEALGHLGRRNLMWLVNREFVIAVLNGLLWASLVAATAALAFQDLSLGLVIAAAMVITIVVAAISGSLLPGILRRLNIDPAIAGGVVLTTITDVTGFFVFLGLATLVYA